jgi:signal transduction histidine kinase
LRRIVSNLLDNALKFAGAVELLATRNAAGTQLSICVQDRGPGIPQHELTAVLQPFYRLESSRSRETGGAGLGLAIAEQLAASLGATLSLRNRDGGGLQACLRIPLGPKS